MKDSKYQNRRILIVDDNSTIHSDFRKILCKEPGAGDELQDLEKALFKKDTEAASPSSESSLRVGFELDSAFQGQQALEMVRKAYQEGRPYTMVFMDIRMPPGWDGVETIERIWKELPDVQFAICSAYSDYSWDELIGRLGTSDHLLVLRKPFEPVVIQQTALVLSAKWQLLHPTVA